MSTTESKSISAEVAGLFDKIREQAREYGRLMTELDTLTRQTSLQGERVREECDFMRAAGQESIRRVDEIMNKALSTIDHKASTLNALYDQLSTIEQTRNSLQDLSSVLQTQKREIEKIIKTSENQIRRIAEESYHNFETRAALQFQQIKDDIRVLDNKLVGLLDLHRREMRLVQDDIDQFKNKVTETKYIVDETTKIVTTMLEEAEQRIDSKLFNAHLAIQMNNSASSAAEPVSVDVNTSTYAGRREVDQLRERLKGLEKSLASQRIVSIGLAIAAMLIALAALIM